jgi:UDPglucose 6-dehydrogenase
MKIVVVGSGYVGLVTGTCFAESGINVICVDVDPEKIRKLSNGLIPIYEPGLESMLAKNIAKKRLSFSTDIKECLEGTDVIFIAVGTPSGEDGSADLSHVLDVAREIGQALNEYIVVVTKRQSGKSLTEEMLRLNLILLQTLSF